MVGRGRYSLLVVVSSAPLLAADGRPAGFALGGVADCYDELVSRDGGWCVDFASPRGGRPPEGGPTRPDPSCEAFRDGAGFEKLARSQRLADVDLTSYDALFFGGGLGVMVDLAWDLTSARVTASAYETGRVVASIGRGPAALLPVFLSDHSPLVAGRSLTALCGARGARAGRADEPFPLIRRLRELGARVSQGPRTEPHVVVDGRLVTGQNRASARAVARAVAHLVA